MDTININGKEYVLKESIKERDVGIMDTANVSMLLRIDEDWITETEILKIPKPKLCFKLNGKLSETTMDFGRNRVFTKAGTKIGYEFVTLADKVIKALSLSKGKEIYDFEVYEGWNEEEKQFVKDYPIVLVSHGYGVIIAPRVEDEDEVKRKWKK